MPRWMYCFVLTAIVIALQYIPAIGIFMMMLMAPFWPVILINLGFVLLARDAWVGDAPRWLAILPALWFGGYGIATSISHWNAHQFYQRLTKENAGKKVAWDPKSTKLLFEGSSADAALLVEKYTIDEAYWRTSPTEPTRVARIVGYKCPSDTVVNGWQFYHLSVEDGERYQRVYTDELCKLIGKEEPQGPVVRVAKNEQPERTTSLNSYRMAELRFVAPGQAPLIVNSGAAASLSWIPQPIIGCALDSGAPAWRCFASFGGESQYPPSAEQLNAQAEEIIPKVLGLQKASLRERYAVNWRRRW